MKLITIKDLIQLPEGTIYTEADSGTYDLFRKDRNCSPGDDGEISDFFCQNLIPKFNGSELEFEGTGRWALYEPESKVALWEKEDIENLIETLQEALKCAV